MDAQKSHSLDVLGIKPIGDAVNTVVKGTVDGAAAFLGRICLPAAEEFGLMLRDRVSAWRASNVVRISEKAEQKLLSQPDYKKRHAHPRLLSSIVENGSWADDNEIQDLWGGLLASSCTESGTDDSNVIFVNLLSQLTTVQARILKYACEHATLRATSAGWITAGYLPVTLDQLVEIAGTTDYHRLDRELDHLRALELLDENSGFQMETTNATITPSPLGLHLYVRCQGSVESPPTFFHVEKNDV